MVRSLSIITLSIIASMSLSLSVSAAPPPTPVGEFAWGTFAEYFRRAVSYPCNNLYYMRGFISTPGDNYMKPDCVLGQNIDKWDLSGNAGTNPATNYIGTQDSQWLSIRTNSIERMFIGTDGNMGIGISVPAVRLHVNTTANEVARFQSSNNPLISLYKNSVRKAYIYQDGNNNTTIANEGTGGLNFFSNGAYRLNIWSNWNIGIGTTTPLADLEIRRNDTDSSLLFHDPSNAWYSMGIDVSDARKFKINYGSGVGDSTHFTMTSIWNVGIWTSTPWAKLEVNGGIYVLGWNGDLDGNNATNNSDAIEIGKWIAGTRVLTPAEYARADINGDGKVNRIDQNLISQIVIWLLTIDEARNDYGKRMESIVWWDVFNWYSVTPNKIGIWVTNPSAKLDVNGDSLFRSNVTINGSLRVTSGGPLSWQVLTALDNLGNTAWRNPAETGVQFTTNTWINSKPDNVNRFFFTNGGRTSFWSQGGFLWKSPTDATIANLDTNGWFYTLGNHVMNNSSPTLYLQDTDNRSAMVHANSNLLYFLRGNGNNSTTWEPFNGYYPLVLNLENNDATFWWNIQVRSNWSFGGYLGIGTSTPIADLELRRDNVDSTILFHDPDDSWFSMGIDRSDSGKFKINYGWAPGESNHFTMTNWWNIWIWTNSPWAKLTILWGDANPLQLSDGTKSFRVWPSVGVVGGFQIYDDQAAAVRMRIDNSGNIGIGTNTPGAKLEVAWSTLANNHIVKAWNGNGFCFWGDCNNFTISMSDSALYRYGPVTDYSIKTQMDASVPGRWFTWGRAGVAPVAALNATSGNFQTAGSVTASSLNVNSVRISGGSPWAGKVLTSDATGNASWETPTTSTAIGGTVAGRLRWASSEYTEAHFTYAEAWNYCLWLSPAGEWRVPSMSEIENARYINGTLFTGSKWYWTTHASANPYRLAYRPTNQYYYDCNINGWTVPSPWCYGQSSYAWTPLVVRCVTDR